LYMMWVSLSGPLWASTFSMSIYISSLDRLIIQTSLAYFPSFYYKAFMDSNYGFFIFSFH
jgi:hypothetical protein